MNPNIVLVICHDLGDVIGPYGYTDQATPRLDALASQSMLFKRHFVASPGCSPSRAAMATGRYPHSNGMFGLAHLGWSMHPGEVTIAALLREAGYKTGMFGTWHIEPPPLESGFDVFSPPTRAEVASANAIEWMTTQARSDAPFFAMVGFFETHRPFCGTDAERAAAKAMDPSTIGVPGYLPDAAPTRQDLAEFHQSVKMVDQNTGRLLDALDAARLASNTLFLFTVDHGIPFPRAKGTLYDPGIKGALLIRWPGNVMPGSTCEAFTSNIDLLPTLLEIAGRPNPEGIQGRSFLPLLTGDNPPFPPFQRGGAGIITPRDAIFAEKTYHEVYDPIRCIRTDRYKYIRNFAERPRLLLPTDIHNSPTRRVLDDEYLAHRPTHELYDLDSDALEQHNLIGHPNYADVQRDLDARLSDWMDATDDPLRYGPIPRQRPLGS